MKTQLDMILRWLIEYETITPIDAMREFGCMRLGARICDLRRAGYEIITEREHSRNRFGQPVCYARYRMKQ